MRTSIIFKLLVIMTMGLWSCNSDKDDDNGIGNAVIPIISGTEGNNDIADFFKTELPQNSDMPSPGFFVNSNVNACRVINSIEELKSLYKGDRELPMIDFRSKTLIIGQQVMPHLGYSIDRQYINVSNGTVKLYLYIKCEPSDFYPAMLMKLYYWGIYPKLNKTTVTVNIVE